MIELGLEIPWISLDEVIGKFESLPKDARPISISEDEDSDGFLLSDVVKLSSFMGRRRSGFILSGENVTYSIRAIEGQKIICDGFLNLACDSCENLMVHIGTIGDFLFGFAALAEEREFRNRISLTLGKNQINAWVGRDSGPYVPGIYWLTLLSKSLIDRHQINVSALNNAAAEVKVLNGGQSLLLRLYDKPDDWLKDEPLITNVIRSQSHIFDIGPVRSSLSAQGNYLAVAEELAKWK